MTARGAFDISTFMEISRAVEALAALAQDTRLRILRALVPRGPDGLSAGRIAQRLGLAAPTLSFHLAKLEQAGLVRCRRDGRERIYAADFAAMRGLVDHLTESCCRESEVACLPAARPAARTRARRA